MKLRTFAIAGLLAMSLAGCDLLSTEPRQSVSPEVGLSSIEGLQGILTSGYARLQGINAYGQRQIIAPEILADNAIINASPSGRYRGEANNQIGSGVGGWGTWYNVISDANYVLSGIDAVDAPPETKKKARGEALFLRGLAYHNLARIYAYEPNKAVSGWDKGVVIRTEPVLQLTEADFRSRESVTKVYEQIEQDLKDAIGLLPAQGAPASARYRATIPAAEALLARVYLYWERWQDAADYATAAMQHSTATLTSGEVAEDLFTKTPNAESIFEVAINSTTETLGVNEAIASLTTPYQKGWFDIVPSAELLALYEPTDLRRTGWYATYSGTTAAYTGVVFSTKVSGKLGNYTDQVPVIRYSEMLLIRAEAYANLSRGGDALTELNTLRAARGASALTAGDLTQQIMDERRRELAFEGHRWFDLKRKGMTIPKPAGTGATALPYTDFRLLSPIPFGEVDLNPNLAQNPGYETD